MKRLIGGLLVLALIALGGLFAAGVGLQRGTQAALAQSGSRAAAVEVAGLPARFALRLEAPELRAPGGRIAWSGAELTARAAVLSPLDWRADLPPEQVLTLDGRAYTIRAEAMQLGAAFGARESLPLTKGTASAARLSLAPAAALPAVLTARDLQADLIALAPTAEAPAPPGGALYRLSIRAAALGLPPEITARLAQGGRTPPAEVENLSIEADFGLARPLDRHARAGMLYPTTIDIAQAQLDWGGRRIEVTGPLGFDAAGRPEGRLMLRLPEWRGWLDLAREAGLVPANRAPMVAAIAGQLAAQSPDGVLALPLTLAGGQMALGPVPLGPIPAVLNRPAR